MKKVEGPILTFNLARSVYVGAHERVAVNVVEPGARPDDAVSLRALQPGPKTVCPLPTRGRSWPQWPGLALLSASR